MEIKPVNQDILGPAGAEQARSRYKPADNASAKLDALGSDFQGYVSRALADSDSNSDVNIEQIRRELDAGQLDSPEAIRQAAQNIFKQGI
jgi:hypothetical protein